jgi:hypothetical protein
VSRACLVGVRPDNASVRPCSELRRQPSAIARNDRDRAARSPFTRPGGRGPPRLPSDADIGRFRASVPYVAAAVVAPEWACGAYERQRRRPIRSPEPLLGVLPDARPRVRRP